MRVDDRLETRGIDRDALDLGACASERESLIKSLLRVPTEQSTVVPAIALLVVLSLALFNRALHFLPSDALDLRLFSVAAHTHNPLKYLIGDWGEAPYETGQFGMYRPLHPISLWVVYKIFGLRWFPNQFINFALHTLNAIALLLLIWRIQRDIVLSFMGASIFLISVHTMSPAVWVTDRASLQVGLALLLLLHHLVARRQAGNKPRDWYIFLLCLFALLSKESGLVLPFVVIVDSFLSDTAVRDRVRSATVWVSLVAVYFLGRFLMFGANAASYSKGGYLFGFWHYDRVVDLPHHLQKFCQIDNIAKNLVQSFLPVLNNEGGFRVFSTSEALFTILGAIAMACLFLVTGKRRLRIIQIECLWIVLFNSLVHNEVFRYRIFYTAQIAVCLFVACSPMLIERRRRMIAVTAATLLLFASTVRVDNYIQNESLIRYNEMHWYKLKNVMQSYPGKRIDPTMAQQLVDGYANH